jgi:hypothetical protein
LSHALALSSCSGCRTCARRIAAGRVRGAVHGAGRGRAATLLPDAVLLTGTLARARDDLDKPPALGEPFGQASCHRADKHTIGYDLLDSLSRFTHRREQNQRCVVADAMYLRPRGRRITTSARRGARGTPVVCRPLSFRGRRTDSTALEESRKRAACARYSACSRLRYHDAPALAGQRVIERILRPAAKGSSFVRSNASMRSRAPSGSGNSRRAPITMTLLVL